MAKLTAEQKDANKAVSKERNAAFSARRKAYSAATEVAERAVASSAHELALEASRKAFDAAVAARSQALADIDLQMEVLRQLRETTVNVHQPLVAAAKAAQSAAWAAKTELLRQLKAEVDHQYPDMVECFYVSLWKRPDGV